MPLTNSQALAGLFGNNMPLLSLLGGMQLPNNVMSLLNPTPPVAPLAGALAGSGAAAGGSPAPNVGTPAAATPPVSPLDRAGQVGDIMNSNVYGTADPQHLGLLASAGFPMFNDPRMIQGYLATMAQNGDQDAGDALRKLLAGGGGGGGTG